VILIEALEFYHRNGAKYLLLYEKKLEEYDSFYFNWQLQRVIDVIEQEYKPKKSYLLSEIIENDYSLE